MTGHRGLAGAKAREDTGVILAVVLLNALIGFVQRVRRNRRSTRGTSWNHRSGYGR